ncbi:MAG TPA: TonB-dependent receptor [Steroidobacteraceae bacterium]|nr:TonB-dependent receptor [Steroidobacteraceae bacterium]
MKLSTRASPITSRALFTIVGGAVLINPVFLHEARAQEQQGEELEEVVVTGLRGSLKASMDTKRDAVGVVDAINAEDIGKFPDTNLSEALQRITGVSIDRRNGEGATVTARGFGPQFNMVTLNGRQMPAADAFGNGTATGGGVFGNSRSFNFANLAAESISAVEVYKTGRADIATGGIGASINVRTARPLDNDGVVMNLGVKAMNDTTNRVGDDLTPELSGIFSYASDDKKFGVGLSASYQKRDSGNSNSTVNDWHIQPWNSNVAANQGVTPLFVDTRDTPYNSTDDQVQANIEHAPANGQLYGIPNDIRYAFSDSERERVNGQVTLQFAPIDGLLLTADYTYALVNLTEDRGEQTIWLQRNGFGHIVFDTNEAVATPVLLHEFTGASKDFGYEQQHREQENQLKSLGFNANWAVSEELTLGFDFHDSKATSMPDDGITGGGETAFSLAGKVPSTCLEYYPANPANPTATIPCRNASNFWSQTFSFNNGLPVAARTLYPSQLNAYANTNGNSDYSFGAGSLGSQVLRIAYQDQTTDIKQSRIDGTFKLGEDDTFKFGVETRSMQSQQRSSGSNMTLGDWGVGDSGTVPDMVALLTPFSLTGAYEDFNPVGAPTGGWKGNANVLGQWALDHGYRNWTESSAPDGELRFNPGYNNNSIVGEDTQAVYAQVALKFELGGKPSNLVVGARYEDTKVHSVSSILVPSALLWQDDNDFQVVRPDVGNETLVSGDGAYHNMLPNLDFDMSFTEALKGRFSYSKTIARANYFNLSAGPIPATPGGSKLVGNFDPPGAANNPGLLPLESDNFDMSIEYYFSDKGYVSLGAFHKNVANFIGNSVVNENLYGIRNQTNGLRAHAALDALHAAGAPIDDSALFTMMAMIEHPEGTTYHDAATNTDVFFAGGAAAYNRSNAQHVAFATAFDLLPNADDPLTQFAVNTPTNNKDAKIHGFEFGGQYFFGDTGFGLLANYTVVRGDVGYDVTSDPNENQFALLGLSDSANAVLMYEKFGLSARLAYNWRDEFLSNLNVGQFRNPIFVEAYDQIDLNVGYDINDHFAVSFEAVNLTGEDVRWHGRSDKQLWRLEDQGARYAVGARYKF